MLYMLFLWSFNQFIDCKIWCEHHAIEDHLTHM